MLRIPCDGTRNNTTVQTLTPLTEGNPGTSQVDTDETQRHSVNWFRCEFNEHVCGHVAMHRQSDDKLTDGLVQVENPGELPLQYNGAVSNGGRRVNVCSGSMRSIKVQNYAFKRAIF